MRRTNSENFAPDGFKADQKPNAAVTTIAKYRISRVCQTNTDKCFALAAIWIDGPRVIKGSDWQGYWQPIHHSQTYQGARAIERAYSDATRAVRKHNKAAGRKPRHMNIERV